MWTLGLGEFRELAKDTTGKWQNWDSNSGPPYSKAHTLHVCVVLPVTVLEPGYALLRIAEGLEAEYHVCIGTRSSVPSVCVLLFCLPCCYLGLLLDALVLGITT